jgi:hypothetical protein
MRYYGGAEGNVLVYHPALGLTSVLKQKEPVGEQNEQEAEDSGNGDGEGVTINLPPPGTIRFSANLFPFSFSLRGCKSKAISVTGHGSL